MVEGQVAAKATAPDRQSSEPVLSMPKGLIGFPGPLAFRVLDLPQAGAAFRLLRSEGAADLSFIVVDPTRYFPDYLPVADPGDLDDVELTAVNDAIWMVIANVCGDPPGIVVNLKAPLLINPFVRLAKQVIAEVDYPVRVPLPLQQGGD